MQRRLSALIVGAVIVGSVAAAAAQLPPGGTFSDDDGNTHEANIEAIAAEGITAGCDAAGSRYCPSEPVTRAQMGSFLARALDLASASQDYFTDDEGSTHEDNINKVAQAAITLGCDATGTRYCPGDHVTRAQMASFLARALGLPASSTDYFTDDAGNTHEDNINAVAAAGITLGCNSDGTLYCPHDNVRRDQMASFIARALGLDPIAPPPPIPPVTFGDGVWEVPSEIPPGIYRSSDTGGVCSWARLSGLSGDVSDIITSSLTEEIEIIEVMATDAAFESDGCGTWSNNLTPRTSSPTAPFGAGAYQVGSEVAVGVWRNSDSSALCYWERRSGFGGDVLDIISNQLSDAIQTVEIKDVDVGFYSEYCGTWTKIG